MSAPTYRPGDIAMVDGKPAVYIKADAWAVGLWHWLDGGTAPVRPEVGLILENVIEIAAETRVQPDSRPAETQHNRRPGRDVQEAP